MGSDIKRLPYRGGNWNNGANAGLAAVNLNNSRANTNTNIGFRPAFGSSQKATPHGALSSALSKGCRCLGYRRKTEQAAPVRRAADHKARMYDQIISFDNLHHAALRCLCGKRSAPAAMRYMQRRFKRAIAAGRLTAGDCRPCIQSWCAHAAHANTWRLRCSLFNISSGANR